MKKDVIKVGLIGLGGMANAHRYMIGELKELKINALCDVNIELLNQIARTEGVKNEKCYTDMEALIADPEVDAVISIVPNNLHAEVLKLCIQYQKPVMAEKPFTLNFKEAKELLPLYEKQPIQCMIGFSYRYIPSFRYAKQLLGENRIGQVRHIEVKYLQQFGSPLFDTPYVWRFNQLVTGTGSLGDLGALMIDTARYLMGEFVSVSALMKTFIHERKDLSDGKMKTVNVDDYASFQAILENGVIGNFITTRNAVGSGNQHEITLYGDLGTIHVNCEMPDTLNLCVEEDSSNKLIFKSISVPGSYRRNQLEDFMDVVNRNEQDGVPLFNDGYQNQKVIEGIIESAETGRMVHID